MRERKFGRKRGGITGNEDKEGYQERYMKKIDRMIKE